MHWTCRIVAWEKKTRKHNCECSGGKIVKRDDRRYVVGGTGVEEN